MAREHEEGTRDSSKNLERLIRSMVSPDTPVRMLAKKMLQHDVGALPVGANDRLIGMVTDRDIAVRGVANDKDISKLTVAARFQ